MHVMRFHSENSRLINFQIYLREEGMRCGGTTRDRRLVHIELLFF